MMPENQGPQLPRRREFVDSVLAVAAVVISVVSLWVAVRTDHTQEALLKSSVWPYVQFTSSNATAGGERHISLEMRNLGVGPAIVRSFAVAYRGRFVATLGELLRACCPDVKQHVYSSTVAQTVIMAHDAIAFIDMPPGYAQGATFEQLNAMRSNIRVVACYCSVLDDCWVFDSASGRAPAAVRHCPAQQQPQYTT